MEGRYGDQKDQSNMKQRIRILLALVAVMLCGAGTAQAATDDLNIVTTGVTGAAVTAYMNTGVPSASAPGTAATTVQHGQYLVLKVTPDAGKWLNNEMLEVQVVGGPGGALIRTRGLVVAEHPTALGTNAADGTGYYYYQIPDDCTGANGYKRVVVTGGAVSKIATTITVAEPVLNLNVLDEIATGATLTPAEAGSLTYSSNNESVAKVEDGIIKALAKGTATITVSFDATAKYAAAESKTITVNVGLNNTSVSVNQEDLDLFVGDEFTIVATTTPSGLNVSYVPDDSGVYSVDNDGLVKALKEGTGSILVKVGDGVVYAESWVTVNVTVSKVPTAITVANDNVELKVNEEVATGATLSPAEAGNLTYTSDKESVAKVVGGKIKAYSEGTATITVSFPGNTNYAAAESKTINVKVSKISTELDVSVNCPTAYDPLQYFLISGKVKIKDTETVVAQGSVDIYLGEEFKLTATVKNSGDDIGTFSCDLGPLNAGTYTPKAVYRDEAGKYGESEWTSNYTISKAGTTITIPDSPIELVIGAEANAGAVLSPADAGTLSYLSNNISVATVDASGKVTAVGAGTTTITVSFAGNTNYAAAESKTITVNVGLNASSVSVDQSTVNLYVGDTHNIVATTTPDGLAVTYTADASGIVSVDADGKVTALKEGTGTITVKVVGSGVYAETTTTVTVTVSKVPTEITVANDNVELKVNEDVATGATLSPTEAGSLTYSSNNEAVAKVVDGKIKAYSEGTATITVSFTGNDKYAAATSKTITVNVGLNDVSVGVDKSSVELLVGGTHNIVATTTPDGLAVTYIDDDSGVISVGTDGKITALKEGTGTITVKVGGDGVYAEKTTTVTVHVTRVLDESNIELTIPTGGYVYDGTAKTPAVTVKYGEKTLAKGTDYTVSYSNNVNAGDNTATVTVTDIAGGDYAVNGTKTFSIAPKAVTLTSGDKSRQYSGSALTNDEVEGKNTNGLTVESGWVGEEGATYSFTGTQTTVGSSPNAFTYTLKSGTLESNYTITKTEGTLTITSKDISSATVTVNANPVFDGNPKTPDDLTVMLDGKTLEKGTDYEITGYANNTDAGTATVTITGKGNYTGSASGTFKINAVKVSISVVNIGDGEMLEGATVRVIAPEGDIEDEWVSVKENHETVGLKAGVEYTLREAVAPDGYTIPTDITFTINSNGMITSTGTITEGGVLLVENAKTEVRVSVVDIDSKAKLKDATVQVLDHDGNVVNEWASTTENHIIKGLKVGVEYTLRETVAPYDYVLSDEFLFIIDETGKITTTGAISDEGVLLVENTKIKKLGTIEVSPSEFTYDGQAHKPTVTANDTDGNVIPEDQYTVSYQDSKGNGLTNPTDADTYTVVITDKTGTGYDDYNVNGTATFVINKRDLTITAKDQSVNFGTAITQGTAQVTAEGLAAGQVLASITLKQSTTSVTTDGKITPSDAVIKIGDTDVTANYDITYKTGTLIINASTAASAVVTANDRTYDGSTQPLVTIGTITNGATGTAADVVFYESATNTTPLTSIPQVTNAGTYEIYYEVIPDGDHTAPARAKVTVKISKATLTVTANDKVITYGDAPANNSVAYDGFADGETSSVLSGTLSYTYNSKADGSGKTYKAGSDVGAYFIIPAGLTSTNYTITFVAGVLTVNAKTVKDEPGVGESQIIIELSPTEYAYDGNEKKPAVTVKDGETTISSNEYTVSYANNVKVGTATVTITDNAGGNYTVSGKKTFVIYRALDGLFVNGNEWATFVAEEDLAVPVGLEAYVVSRVSGTTMNTEAAAYVAKGVGILLKRTDKTVNSYKGYAYVGEAAPPVSLLRGSATAATDIEAYEDYVLYNDQFELAGVSSVAKGHAYLPKTAISGKTGSRRLSISVGGNDTDLDGIDAVFSDNEETKEKWYDLNGRRLSGKPTRKGLYIKDGRKVVIK